MAYITSEPIVFKPRSNRYDVASWLDGQEWVIEKGTDFATVAAVRASIRNAAAKANTKVVIRETADGNLYVHATGPRPAKLNHEHTEVAETAEVVELLPEAA
jgi:hypothetical protein